MSVIRGSRLALSLACGALVGLARANAAEGIRIGEADGRLRVEIDGQLFTEYWFKDVPRPFFYPLIGPGGAPMTRNYPMKEVAGEDHDHPHHRSLWFTHGSVNGVDFWSEQRNFGRIVHDRFLEVKGGAAEGVIRSADRWVAPDGTVVCTDERVFRVHRTDPSERRFDFEVTLKAGDKPVVLGDTKEGSMAIRLNEQMRVKRPDGRIGEGRIVTSGGAENAAAWGQRAKWCAYTGPVDGKTYTVIMHDDPRNPRHPTWWHVREYGLFAANPFGQHPFEKKPAGAGDLTIPAGGSATFAYRFVIRQGPPPAPEGAAPSAGR